MKILIDIGHPAHVHYFRNLAMSLAEKGYSILFTARDKEVTIELLKHYQLPFKIVGRPRPGFLWKSLALICVTFKILIISLKFKPDMLLNASPSAALVACLMRKPHIALEDTFNMEQVWLYLPFTSVVLTGDYPHRSLGRKEIRYPGYQELLYLHPNNYKPGSEVLSQLGLQAKEKYAIVRFVAWNATHDYGHQGIPLDGRLALVKALASHLRVFVSSEQELPDDLARYKINISPEQMHDALYHAHLFVGEGATMASEAAILGTPSIFIHSTRFGNVDDLAAMGLLYQYSESESDQKIALLKAMEIAKDDEAKTRMVPKRVKLLRKKIDVNAFLLWFVEIYPASMERVRCSSFDFSMFVSVQ